jgi:hypothetical protein
MAMYQHRCGANIDCGDRDDLKKISFNQWVGHLKHNGEPNQDEEKIS